MAAAVPIGAVGLAVLAVRRYGWARWAVALVAAAVLTWGVLTGVLQPRNVAVTFTRVGAAAWAQAGGLALQLLLVATLVAWLAVLVPLSQATAGRARVEAWVLRHRRGLTYVAAAGPLPYFLLRMSWLTPGPVGAPGILDAEIRLWGLLLGCAGLAGSILTLGLVLPWGRTLPRWWPGAAGRPVPVAAAVVPGLTVAVAVTLAAVPTALSAFDSSAVASSRPEQLLYLLVFPFWLWGPALLLAVAGYALSRSDQRAERQQVVRAQLAR